jgi:hypothetical protein
MKKISVILLFLFLCSYSVRAQFLDSIQQSLNRNGSFSLIFNSRHSSISTNNAYVFALMIGVRFDRKIGMGGGINVLDPAVPDSIHIGGQGIQRHLYFTYISYYLEYLLRLSKHWELDLFFMPGIGSSYYQYYYEGKTITQGSNIVIPLEPSACLEYDFTKWIGFYVQAGYRWMLVNNPAINEKFNSPTYAAGLVIYPLEVYAAIFPHTKLAHMIEDN